MSLTAFINLLCVLYTCVCLVLCQFTSTDEIKNIFGSKHCIEGSLSTISANSQGTLLVNELNNYSTYIQNISSSENKNEKTAMTKLHELAQYNNLKYFYKLEKEEGPPHNKLFTLSLKLGDEEFISEGSTLKKAQQNLASIALENTNYQPPPFKENEQNTDALTPTVLLNNLGAKLGIQVTYYLINKDAKDMLNTNVAIDGPLKKSYLQKLNESIYSDNDIHIRKDDAQSKGPFKVMVEVGDATFYGTSYTVQSARHEAATKAVDHLVKKIQGGKHACLNEDSKECEEAKAKIKSPISLVYEAAQLRDLDLVFDVIKEEGPSHKKTFTTQCRLGDFVTTGEGMSKKESKRMAAVNMLDKLDELPEVSQEVVVRNLLKDKDKRRKKKNKVIKTKFDMINMHVDNFIDAVWESVPITSSNVDGPIKSFKKSAISKTSKENSGKSYQDKMLEVSNMLKFEVQYTDTNDKDEYLSILSLHIKPDHICLGKGVSTKMARNKAAEGGLKLLQNLPLESHFRDKKLTILESDVKNRIHSLLNQDISKDK